MELLSKTCSTETMNIQRLLARIFVILGGIFWVGWIAGAEWGYLDSSLEETMLAALVPLAGVVLVFLLGLFYERLAGVLLIVIGVIVLAWGVVAQWEPVVWGTMFLLYAGPCFVAGALYLLAARMQDVCTLNPA